MTTKSDLRAIAMEFQKLADLSSNLLVITLQ